MICDVCGRKNADNLSFCQDCGRQLRGRDTRGVSPTPPNGLPAIERHPIGGPNEKSGAPRAAAPITSPFPPRVAPAGRGRPEAPIFSFGPPITENEGEADAAAEDEGSAEIDVELDREGVCDVCEAHNPPGYRFCVTCGAALRAPAPSASRTNPGESSEPPGPMPPVPGPAALPQGIGVFGTSSVPAGAAVAMSEDKIIGSPVVEIAGARSTPAKLVTCARCHGQSVAGTRFCKYCGASLDDTSAAGPRRYDDRRDLAQPPLAPSLPQVDVQAPSALPQASHPQAAPDRASDVHNLSPNPASPGAYDPYGSAGGHAADASVSPVYAASFAMGARPLEARSVFSPHDQGQGAGRVNQGGMDAGAGRGGGIASGNRLVSITEDGSEGKSYPLNDNQVDIGRSEGDIVLHDDPYVSPRHARLLLEGGRWVLRDLNSTNHIYLRIKKAYPLRDADLLLLGLEVLQFQIVSDAERGLGHATQHGTLLFGSPATPRRARLCQKTVEGVIRDVYHLYKDETVIGRETADIVFSADPFLSRRHAVIRRNASTGEYTAADLDSSNGTYVAIRGDVTLSSGDFVRIGQHLFRLDLA